MIRRFLAAAIVLGAWSGVNLYATSEPTFVSGVEDTLPGAQMGAFSDIIFSLTGSGLTLDTAAGQWNTFDSGVVNQNNTNTPAYFDNVSANGADENVGFCLTTANCGSATQTAGASLNEYLSDTGDTSIPAPGFYFTSTGSVTFSLLASLAGSNNSTESVGVYDMTSHAVTWVILDDVLQNGGVVNTSAFPSDSFQLIYEVGTAGTFFYSDQTTGFVNGVHDIPADNRYALFSESEGVPEPATMALFGIGALALGMVGRLRKRRG